jgi:pimeloyl-ACP methyl ester carboxylesterase
VPADYSDPADEMPGTSLAWTKGMRLFVRRQRTPGPLEECPAVLYVHGATFPSGLSVGYPFEGRSWASELAAAGFDVWALDFAGYGRSSRYPQQDLDPAGAPPLGRAAGPAGAGEQLATVLEHIGEVRGDGRVSLVAHSWGTIAAGVAATSYPELIDRVVLFGPITRRSPSRQETSAPLGAWHPLTVQDQYERFVADVPRGHPPVLTRQFPRWARDWLATDPNATERTPPSVRTPSGPRADIFGAWSGNLAYDPALIEASTLIVRGEWDSLCTDADARWLFDALTGAPMRREVKISGGTHLMHLESSRFGLYRESETFLLGGDGP